MNTAQSWLWMTQKLQNELEDSLGKPWKSRYVFRYAWRIDPFTIVASMRDSKGFMGRFGGGWNWEVGFQLGGKTLLIHLLVMSITINYKPFKEQKS